MPKKKMKRKKKGGGGQGKKKGRKKEKKKEGKGGRKKEERKKEFMGGRDKDTNGEPVWPYLAYLLDPQRCDNRPSSALYTKCDVTKIFSELHLKN